MTQQGKPGWYPDGTGQQRWWDGRGWTVYTRSDASGTTPQPVPVPAAPTPTVRPRATTAEIPAARQPRPARRRLPNTVAAALTGAALIIGLILGGASGRSDHGDSAGTAKLTATVSGLQTSLRSTTSERDRLKAAAAAVASRAEQLDSKKTLLDERATALSKRSSKLDTREKKVVRREAAVKRKAAAVADATSSSSSSDSSSDGSSSAAPGGATAQCSDGTYSYSAHRSGTCSHHGGVAIWL